MISISFRDHMPLTTDSPIRLREVGSRLSAALRLDRRAEAIIAVVADSVRCCGWMAALDIDILLGDTPATGRSYLPVGIWSGTLAAVLLVML